MPPTWNSGIMFTTVLVSPVRTIAGVETLTIDVIFSQFPRLYYRKRADNETPEGVRHDLFLAARPGSVEDKGIVTQPM